MPRKRRSRLQVWSGRMMGWLFIAMLLITGGYPQIAQAAENPLLQKGSAVVDHHRQVLIVLVNRLDVAALQQMPHAQQLAAKGAIGLMNVNTGGKHTDANAYATMALGVPTRLQQEDLLVFNANQRWAGESVASAYQQIHGTGSAHGQGVLMLASTEIARSHSQREYAGTMGELGDALQRAGLQAAVFGASDTGGRLWRPAALLTGDSFGRTAWGDVGPRMLTADSLRPDGVRTDYGRLWTAYTQVRRSAALTVFDLGDLYRLQMARPHLGESRYQKLQVEVLREIDAFLEKVSQEVSAERLVLLAVPQVSAEASEHKEWLSPVIAAGGALQPGTVLTSATTRRAGIVSNLDVAPTVLQMLGVPHVASMIGYPLQSSTELAPTQLTALEQASLWTYGHRATVLMLAGAWTGCVLLAVALWLCWGMKMTGEFVQGLLSSVLALPLLLYLVPLLAQNGMWTLLGGLLVLYLLVVQVPFHWLPVGRTAVGRVAWLCSVTVVVIIGDVWLGGTLGKSGLLSYDPIVGARYYGVGNEYMGVVVGAAVLLHGMLSQVERLHPRWLTVGSVVCGGLLTAFFASPALGANTGGALTMAGTTALCLVRSHQGRRRTRVLALLGALVMAMGLLAWLNREGTMPSHIGTALRQIMQGGGVEVLRIVVRKSDMVVRLFFASIWSPLVLAALVVAGVGVRRLSGRNSGWLNALFGGATIGLCTNDSGIVVAAMMLLLGLFAMLLIDLDDEKSASRVSEGCAVEREVETGS